MPAKCPRGNGHLIGTPPAFPSHSWLNYLTSVNPGSAIQFLTASYGWRVDGHDGAPHLDGRIGAGPAPDQNLSWPGDSVAESADGGRTWKTMVTVPTGIWGMDLLSPQAGWVVGVTTLLRTSDGGTTWQAAGEPPGQSLVLVDFVSPQRGYGLTTSGQLFDSNDAGGSWTPAPLTARAGAICFSSPATGYASALDGSLYRTADAGASWARAAGSPLVSASPQISLNPLWSYLSCGGGTVWRGLLAWPPIMGIRAGDLPYAVSVSHDEGLHWSVTSANAGGIAEMPAAAKAQPGHQLAGLALAPAARAAVVDLPATGWRIDVTSMPDDAPATVPVPAAGGVGPPVSSSDLHVLGITFIGSEGWMYFDNSGLGSAGAPRWQWEIYKTDDAGATWTPLAASPVRSRPA